MGLTIVELFCPYRKGNYTDTLVNVPYDWRGVDTHRNTVKPLYVYKEYRVYKHIVGTVFYNKKTGEAKLVTDDLLLRKYNYKEGDGN